MPRLSTSAFQQQSQLIRGALLVTIDPDTEYRPIVGNLRSQLEAAKRNIEVTRRLARQTELQMYFQLGNLLEQAKTSHRPHELTAARAGARLNRRLAFLAGRIYGIFKNLPEYLRRVEGVTADQFGHITNEDYLDIVEEFEDFYRQRQEVHNLDMIMFSESETDETESEEDYPNDYPVDCDFGDDD